MSSANQSERLHDLLQVALRQALNERTPGREWHFERCGAMTDVVQQQTIVLTLASFRVRLLCLLHIDMSRGGLTHEVLAGKTSEGSDSDHEDYIREFGNSVCGNLKRDIQAGLPPLGMSTPNVVHHSSMAFLDKADEGSAAHLTVSAADGQQFKMGASILLYPHAGFTIEVPRVSLETSDDSGELELF